MGGSCTMNKDVLEISLQKARGREHSLEVCGHCVGGNTLVSMQAPSIWPYPVFHDFLRVKLNWNVCFILMPAHLQKLSRVRGRRSSVVVRIVFLVFIVSSSSMSVLKSTFESHWRTHACYNVDLIVNSNLFELMLSTNPLPRYKHIQFKTDHCDQSAVVSYTPLRLIQMELSHGTFRV